MERTSPKFSIIIPLYNKERFVKATIDSVLMQDFTDYELIIVDDGSTDGSLPIVERIGDPRIRIIRQPNSGVSAARNNGIESARGKYIIFLDADDLWQPGFLATMDSMTREYPDDSFFCTAQVGRIIPGLPEGISIIDDLCTWNYIYGTGCICIRTSVFKEIGGFRTGIQLGEDRDMWLRIGCKHRTVYLNKGYMYHPAETMNNLSRTINPVKSFPYWEWYSYDYPLRSSLYRYATDMLLLVVGQLIDMGDYKMAWFFLRKCKGFTSLRWRWRYAIKILRHTI